jgi:hypothetical protein
VLKLVGEITPLKPAMKRDAEDDEMLSFVMASLATFIETRGYRPVGCVVSWIDRDHRQRFCHFEAEPHDLAMLSVALAREATGG